MTIPPRFLDEIRSRLTLSDIIGQRIRVTRAGRESKACCPFHKEKTPSFTINDEKGFYHCFGCGAHGDVVNFVMQHDNLPFPEAVEQLAARACLQVPKSSPEDIQKAKIQKDLFTLMNDAAQWFEARLFENSYKDCLDYVRGRGLSVEIIQAFRLGFAPSDPQALRKYLLAKGYSDQQMIELSLIKPSSKGSDPYCFFRDRIMVPVTDRQGRVIAFGGRILPDHMRPPDRGDYVPAKYMNSGETPIFDKGRVLFGESHARHAAAEGQNVIVAEGYFDVIALHQAGFKGAVAPMGTALTESQIAMLWRMIPTEMKEPVLCFDGDNAGRKAAQRAAERILPLLSAGQSARFAFLPDGEDPDTLVRSGGAMAFRHVLDSALPMIDYLWQNRVAGRVVDTPEKRAGLVKILNDDIRQIADREVQKQYDMFIRSRISEAFYKKPYNGSNQKGKSQAVNPGGGLRRPSVKALDLQNRILLAAIINHPQIFNRIEEQLSALVIEDDSLEGLRQRLWSILSENEIVEADSLKASLAEQGYGEELDFVLSRTTYMHGRFAAPEALGDVASKWLEFFADSRDKALNQELKAGWKEAFDNTDSEAEDRMRALSLSRRAE
jgi:DNA primase